MADLLDDLADVRSALHGYFYEGAMRQAAVCKLSMMAPPRAKLQNATQLSVQALAHPDEKQATRDRVHTQHRLEKLKNLPLITASDIGSASQFKKRLETVVCTVSELSKRYEMEQRSNWWHMADLLVDLLDLMDAVRSNPHNKTTAIFAVIDLPQSSR